ncbi:hypothetical protein JB92DRAFT_3131661 [Gautieria morchelliformis]|nr:hypothetical protein JB92DRAFT_3131661 [Gautieria morchelliformis]
MPTTSSNIRNVLTNAPLPASPQSSAAKSKSKKKKSTSEATTVQPPAKLVESSPQKLTEPRTIAPPVVGDVPIAKDTSSSKSKMRPHPNFAAVENHERDVMHDLEMLDLSTASQTSKSKKKKKKSVAVATSMALKKGVSGMKRKKPVEDNDCLDRLNATRHSSQSQWCPAKGKEKTAKKTKVAKGASNKKSASTATGSSGVRKTKCQGSQ